MVEKFSDFESAKYLDKEGVFTFTVKDAEVKDSSKGNAIVVFTVEAPEGQSTLYFVLTDKAKWKYNLFIKACLFEKLNTPEKIAAFTLDYELIHKELIGKKFVGKVEEECYEKEIKVPNADGTFDTRVEDKISYKITEFSPVTK